MVIVLLGIMMTFSSQFIGLGSRFYQDASRREQLMGDARFALERLNRELRDAVPGSLRVEDTGGTQVAQGACLRFWPIARMNRYLALNQAQAGNLLLTVVEQELAPRVGDWAIVYPIPVQGQSLEQGCEYGNCVARVTATGTVTANVRSLRVDRLFAGESPAKRVYFADRQVLYCVSNGQLRRGERPLGTALGSADPDQLMAEHLQSADRAFYHQPDSFTAEDSVGLRWEFARDGESVIFNHMIEVLNVP